MSSILVTGSASGLGLEIFKALIKVPENLVYPYDIINGADVCSPNADYIPRKLDVLINCAGINKIDWLGHVTEEQWDAVMNTNAKGIFKMTQACLPMLVKSKGTVLNIVSNASAMPMTCSLAYNASKGAAHIMTLQLARELTRQFGITVFGISPNKLAGTRMSEDIDRQVCQTRGWTMEHAREYQLAGLLAGEETPPERVAEFIAFLLSSKERHKHLTGCVIPYGA